MRKIALDKEKQVVFVDERKACVTLDVFSKPGTKEDLMRFHGLDLTQEIIIALVQEVKFEFKLTNEEEVDLRDKLVEYYK